MFLHDILTQSSLSVKIFSSFAKLSAGRRTIVHWPADDRSPASGQSFASQRTIDRQPANDL
ncbi:hypothetical protein [uncultured Parabacteroides sp.]|uniref:hypothetical protein n=1 Tax=uncultured Parabacteroides sp. TaxID=512312 RepID=UPI0026144FD0|nr:hypothetical protein [uncultured Parabacteroides sp.]